MQHPLFNDMQNILPFEGEAFFYPAFFSKEKSDHFFHLLQNTIHWKQEAIKIFGKQVLQPRLTTWYGDAGKAYSYSGITLQPNAWTDPLPEIKSAIEKVAGLRFTGALLNFYRDGNDSMGWHHDNEKELGINPVIGSVSFGAARTFRFRHARDTKLVKSIELTHGSFLLMKGETQHHWKHQLPKTSRDTGKRINITFRVIG